MVRVNAESQRAKINNYYKGFVATHLINIGDKLGIFETLIKNKEGLTIPTLASKLDLYEPYLKIFCQTAYCLEILDFDSQGRFKLEPFLNEVLGDKSHFRNMTGLIDLAINVNAERFKLSPTHYKTGEILKGYTSERSKLVGESTRTLHTFLNVYFRTLPPTDPIKNILEQGIRFLDIGCGNGRFIIQLAHEFKKSKFTGIDPISYGIDIAKETISQLGLKERVNVECLAGEDLKFNNEFDIVSMVLTFHEILPEFRAKVLENAYKALKDGGRLLIFDFAYPDKLEDFRNPKYELGVIDQFNETCLGVIVLNNNEQNELLTKIGFKEVKRDQISGIDIILLKK